MKRKRNNLIGFFVVSLATFIFLDIPVYSDYDLELKTKRYKQNAKFLDSISIGNIPEENKTISLEIANDKNFLELIIKDVGFNSKVFTKYKEDIINFEITTINQSSIEENEQIIEIPTQGLVQARLHGKEKNFKLDEIFIKYERLNKPIEAVIHCAGLKSVSESIYTPLEYWDVNVVGTLNLLKIMEKFNCKKIVFSSSATIYGDSKDNLIKEDNSISPVNTYGSTKAAVEEILKNFFEKKDAFYSIAILRYFNPIGAHPSGYIGELPKNKPNNLFPFITQVAKKQRTNLDVFGSNWPTIDGTGVRDYIHILDLADGHLEALEYLFKNKKRIIKLNLGTGLGTSVLELVRTFETVNKIKIPIRFVGRREGDVAKLVADNSEAKKILNWEPKRNIKDMCIDGWNYINNLK